MFHGNVSFVWGALLILLTFEPILSQPGGVRLYIYFVIILYIVQVTFTKAIPSVRCEVRFQSSGGFRCNFAAILPQFYCTSEWAAGRA